MRWITLSLTAACMFLVATCLQAANPRPYLTALSVSDLTESIRWYRTYLGFDLISRNDYPDYQLSIAMLGLGDFSLELIEHGESITLQSVLPDPSNPATVRGIVKLAFWIDDIEAKAALFAQAGAEFKMQPRRDDSAGTLSFIVVDVDGNWIQFSGSISN